MYSLANKLVSSSAKKHQHPQPLNEKQALTFKAILSNLAVVPEKSLFA